MGVKQVFERIRREDEVVGNLTVLLAALGVFGTGTGWPDLMVAAIMASLALQGAWIVVQQARDEWQAGRGALAARPLR